MKQTRSPLLMVAGRPQKPDKRKQFIGFPATDTLPAGPDNKFFWGRVVHGHSVFLNENHVMAMPEPETMCRTSDVAGVPSQGAHLLTRMAS